MSMAQKQTKMWISLWSGIWLPSAKCTFNPKLQRLIGVLLTGVRGPICMNWGVVNASGIIVLSIDTISVIWIGIRLIRRVWGRACVLWSEFREEQRLSFWLINLLALVICYAQGKINAQARNRLVHWIIMALGTLSHWIHCTIQPYTSPCSSTLQ